MEFSKKKNFLAVFLLSLPFLAYFSFVPMPGPVFDVIYRIENNLRHIVKKPNTQNFVYTGASLTASTGAVPAVSLPKKLENPPAVIKAMYATGWSAGTKKYLDYADILFKTTQINAIVVDVKDGSGVVSYLTQAKGAVKNKAYFPEISNIDALVRHFHDQGIYVIGRIAVFEDPVLAKSRPDLAIYDTSKTKDLLQPVLWQDNNKLSWVDPAAKEVYDYNIEIAKDALSHGFDEINFDYVRFPTDGKAENMGFPKWDKKIPKNAVIKGFFKKLREGLPDAKISADLFGQTTSNTDDMGIGQIWEDALPYFDYVSPMAYPSHYIKGFLGYQNPADYPYQVVKYEIDKALARQKVLAKIMAINVSPDPKAKPAVLAKIRPWLQDFNMGAKYDAIMVKEEIRAVSEVLGKDFAGYMLWNPSNIYTGDALLKEPSL